jgi:ATPase subunit of ABC transporter with duplicated ATPase domains
VTAVAEISEHAGAGGTLARYDGGWQAFLDERARARAHAEEDYRVYLDRRDTLRERSDNQRRWAAKGVKTAKRSGETDKFIRHRNIQASEHVAAKARQTDRALARLAPVDKPWEGWDLRLTIADAGRSGDVVARLDGAVVELGEPGHDGPAFRLGPVSVEVSWGDRLAIVGRNGSGKSTLLAALLGRVPLAAGHRWLGPGVVVGEISQDRELFDEAKTLLDGFQAVTGGTVVSEARSLLAKFGLGAEHVVRPAGSLSPGERTRATLAVLQAVGVNLLVLDEPTNHLDLPAIEQLEQAVSTFGGTLVLVTHDRRLLENIGVTRTIELTAGTAQELP